MYYSQFGEDRILAALFGERRGTCAEVGANDGYHGSTTLYFEQRGWECVLVEPNPLLCQVLRERRTARVFEAAASSATGSAVLQLAEGEGLAHAVSTIATDKKADRSLRAHGVSVRPVTVQTRTLDDMFEEAGIHCIDFISIDVEGHEMEALKGFSVDRWRPTILIIEDNSTFGDSEVSNYLASFGYVRFRRTGVNDWFAHKSNGKLAGLRGRLGYFPSMVRGRLLMASGHAKVRMARVFPRAARAYKALRRKL